MRHIRNTRVESLVKKRYSLVHGETEAEVEMVDFFKQAIAADGAFIINVTISRHWGNNHLETDTSLTTTAKPCDR